MAWPYARVDAVIRISTITFDAFYLNSFDMISSITKRRNVIM